MFQQRDENLILMKKPKIDCAFSYVGTDLGLPYPSFMEVRSPLKQYENIVFQEFCVYDYVSELSPKEVTIC